MILSDKELSLITGGTISSTVLNAAARCISVFFDLGRSIGSAIRRISSKSICEL